MYNPPPDWCRHCWSGMPYEKPNGKVGLFGGRFGEWLAGEIGDVSWLQWLIHRDCPKCGGTGEIEYRRPDPPQGSQALANQVALPSVLELCAMQQPPGAGMGWHLAHGMNLLSAMEREKQLQKPVSQQFLDPI